MTVLFTATDSIHGGGTNERIIVLNICGGRMTSSGPPKNLTCRLLMDYLSKWYRPNQTAWSQLAIRHITTLHKTAFESIRQQTANRNLQSTWDYIGILAQAPPWLAGNDWHFLAQLPGSTTRQNNCIYGLLVFGLLGCYDYTPLWKEKNNQFWFFSQFQLSVWYGHFRHISNCAFLGERVLVSELDFIPMSVTVEWNLKWHVCICAYTSGDEMEKSFYVMEFYIPSDIVSASSLKRSPAHIHRLTIRLIADSDRHRRYSLEFISILILISMRRPPRIKQPMAILPLFPWNRSKGRQMKATHLHVPLVGFPWVGLLCLAFLLFF